MRRAQRARVDDAINDVGARYVPERRTAVYDVRVEEDGERWVLTGETTAPEAPAALKEALGAIPGAPATISDRILRLPDAALGDQRAALVRAALAPVLKEPVISAAQVSQYVLGHRIDLLSRHGAWWRARGEDGYVGWVHDGYLQIGTEEWARQWEQGEGGEPVVSLGTELFDDGDRVFARAPWGARLIRDMPRRFRLPDGRRGILRDEVDMIDADRLSDRFPPRGESVTRTARLWWGTPYVWGGVTPAGADCSGYVQSVFWMHGIALPRDSELQSRVGTSLPTDGISDLRPGDLLYFAERRELVTHVAISLGGADIIHCALSNGGVEFNVVGGELDLERRLEAELVAVRRVLPD